MAHLYDLNPKLKGSKEPKSTKAKAGRPKKDKSDGNKDNTK